MPEGGPLEDEPAQPGQEPPQPQADPLYAEVEQALNTGDLDGAKAAYQRILDKIPQDAEARRGLAAVELSLRVQSLDADAVLRRAAADPGDVQAQTQAADIELISGRVDEAFDRLVAAVRRTAGDDRDAVRKHLLGLFEMLPADDPRVGKARRGLQSALF
jgi:putative thioredoxin